MDKNQLRPNYILWGIIGLFVAGFIALFIYNQTHKPAPEADKVWNQAMSKGSDEAEHKFIEYTDVTCSHCAEFHEAAHDGGFDKDYIDSGKVKMETRIVPLLQKRRQNSVRATESAYCAADQNKFWPYYDAIVANFQKNYFSKNIATLPTSPDMPKLSDDFYVEIAKKWGLDASAMSDCLKNNQQQVAVQEATKKAAQALPYGAGVPYFKVNNYESSGFSGGYASVKRMMKAGGVN